MRVGFLSDWRGRMGLGAVLLGAAWSLSWGLTGLRTHALFFPHWLGAILLFDAWTQRRTQSSLWLRSRRAFAGTFLVSMPLWWLFEALNVRLENWIYLGRESFSDLEFALWSSLSFSTVVPAVLVLSEWAASFPWVPRLGRGPKLPERWTRGSVAVTLLFGLGAVQLACCLAWPRYCFAFAWTSGVFLLESACVARRVPGLTHDLGRGDWSRWLVVWAGGLACGALWEMWNWYAFPKWIYSIPGVDFWPVFEMPALGYLGYLPFAHAVLLASLLAFPASARARLGPLAR